MGLTAFLQHTRTVADGSTRIVKIDHRKLCGHTICRMASKMAFGRCARQLTQAGRLYARSLADIAAPSAVPPTAIPRVAKERPQVLALVRRTVCARPAVMSGTCTRRTAQTEKAAGRIKDLLQQRGMPCVRPPKDARGAQLFRRDGAVKVGVRKRGCNGVC